MSKDGNVSENELQDMLRKLGVEACAKAFAGAKRTYDRYPKASLCGRCGAKKGCCGCAYFPYLGSDALYQLSRLHAQNVGHMVRMGLSTWDILTKGGRCHHCDHEPCRCKEERGCFHCGDSPCRCPTATGIKSSEKPATSEVVSTAAARLDLADGVSIETMVERLKYDVTAPNLKPYVMLESRNRSNASVAVELNYTEFTHGDGKKKVQLKPTLQYSSRKAGPQKSASVYVYFDLTKLMAEKWKEEAVIITPLTGYLTLSFNDSPVARTKVIVEVNQFKGKV